MENEQINPILEHFKEIVARSIEANILAGNTVFNKDGTINNQFINPQSTDLLKKYGMNDEEIKAFVKKVEEEARVQERQQDTQYRSEQARIQRDRTQNFARFRDSVVEAWEKNG